MKTALMIIASMGVLFIIIQIYLIMITSSAKVQPYKIVSIEKDFEIRFYPAATMATIISSAKTYKELGNTGFRKLARFILWVIKKIGKLL
jgi:cytochrome bd-type quinol oxidase subunit 1